MRLRGGEGNGWIRYFKFFSGFSDEGYYFFGLWWVYERVKCRKIKRHKRYILVPLTVREYSSPLSTWKRFPYCGKLKQELPNNQEQSSWTKNNPLGFSLRPQREQSSLSVFLVSNNPENKDTIVCLICIRVWIMKEQCQSLDWSFLFNMKFKMEYSSKCSRTIFSMHMKMMNTNLEYREYAQKNRK